MREHVLPIVASVCRRRFLREFRWRSASQAGTDGSASTPALRQASTGLRGIVCWSNPTQQNSDVSCAVSGMGPQLYVTSETMLDKAQSCCSLDDRRPARRLHQINRSAEGLRAHGEARTGPAPKTIHRPKARRGPRQMFWRMLRLQLRLIESFTDKRRSVTAIVPRRRLAYTGRRQVAEGSQFLKY